MNTLNQEQVCRLHRMLTTETGGNPGLRDPGLLNSALYAAHQTFGGVELYPTVEEKAARLAHSLIANHAFADGNKRIGMLVLFVFLEINGICLHPSAEEFTRVGLALAAGEMGYDELLAWIRRNRETE